MPSWTTTSPRIEQDQTGASPACYAAPMHIRTDRLTAAHVDLAINLAVSHGVAAGARALFEYGLSLELARRVLLRPAERRADYLAFTALQASNRSTTRS
jgi:hypothetical protein